MRVAVVSDEPLLLAIDRLRGEWKLATDGVIEAVLFPPDAELEANSLKEAGKEFDLIVFPSRLLGPLCELRMLRPMRPNVLKSQELRFSDILPLVREHEIVYAQQVMALPLGCPTPLLIQPKPVSASGEAPVTTGDRFAAPEDEIELALAYLAWAAPHAVHRSRIATLFDSDTFEPRLAASPFIRALERFVERAQGRTTVAWPRRQTSLPDGDPETDWVVAPMPRVAESYNALADEWEAMPEGNRQATLLASSGRLIGVTEGTRNAATAFRFAAWLAGPENASQISTASDSVANCRGTRARSVDGWRDTEDRALARSFSEVSAEALREPRYLLAPRLSGSEEYLAALGKRVRSALEGAPPEEALAAAAADWEAISTARGREAQRAAYKRSLNSARFPAGM